MQTSNCSGKFAKIHHLSLRHYNVETSLMGDFSTVTAVAINTTGSQQRLSIFKDFDQESRLIIYENQEQSRHGNVICEKNVANMTIMGPI